MDEKKAWVSLKDGDLKGLEEELSKTRPEGKVFEEIDILAGQINKELESKHSLIDPLDVIKRVLDDWVSKRVVRFQWSDKCDGEQARTDEGYKESVEGEIMDYISGSMIENCGLTEIKDDELILTFYALAFKEVF